MIVLKSLEDREIYKRIVPEILLDQNEEQVAQEWARHQAIAKVAGLCLTDQIDPEQFLDGCFDAIGNQIDPYLDEMIIGLSHLVYGHS
jgi:hypothetical protein